MSEGVPLTFYDESLTNFFSVLEELPDAPAMLTSLESFILDRFSGRAVVVIGSVGDEEGSETGAEGGGEEETGESGDDDSSDPYDGVDTTATRPSLLSQSLLRQEAVDAELEAVGAAGSAHGRRGRTRSALTVAVESAAAPPLNADAVTEEAPGVSPSTIDVHHICILPAPQRRSSNGGSVPFAVHLELELSPPPSRVDNSSSRLSLGSLSISGSGADGLAGDSISAGAAHALKPQPCYTASIRLLSVELAVGLRAYC